MGHRIDAGILREYDIRGVVGRTLGPADAVAVGRGFATRVWRAGGTRVAVGRDGRTTSPLLEAALIEGLTAGGIDVVRIGPAPTPMLYHAEAVLEVDGAIQVTGSHNPPDVNGFKFVLQHRPFYGADIAALGTMAETRDWTEGAGGIAGAEMLDDYVARLVAGYAGGAFRIGWDAGNGAAGPVVDALVRELPGEHHTLFTEVDGRFPNHPPDPSDEANLEALRALVLDRGLDFGVAFDGDGDRIGVIDGRGRMVRGDLLLAILAAPVLRAAPGATIVADVKTSRVVFDRIAALGGTPLMWKTGHSPMKAKMHEIGAPLGGEISGHVYFGPEHHGIDDGLYAAVRLMAAVRFGGGSLADLVDALPATVATPELRLPCPADRKAAVVVEILARLEAAGTPVDRTDGARVDTEDGWWLIRASNTEDALTVRAEAGDAAGLDRLRAAVDAQLAASGLDPLPAR